MIGPAGSRLERFRSPAVFVSGGVRPSPNRTMSTVKKRILLFDALVGGISLIVALMSVVDMFVPKPWDGISTAWRAGGEGLEVVAVEPESGAARAGIEPGDRIVGIAGKITTTETEAAQALLQQTIGKSVPYLVKKGDHSATVDVVPEAVLLGNRWYLYDAFLGALFFLVGLMVVTQRPDDEASQVFFLLCDLFVVFLLCRLRPSSYYWVDYFVQNAGTLALFLLPAVFLHFFLIFPERKHFNLLGEDDPYAEPPSPFRLRLDRWVNRQRHLFAVVYILPPIAYLAHLAGSRSAPAAPLGGAGDQLDPARQLPRPRPPRPRPQPGSTPPTSASGGKSCRSSSARSSATVPFVVFSVVIPSLHARPVARAARDDSAHPDPAHLRLRHRPLPAAERAARRPPGAPLRRDDRLRHGPLRPRHRDGEPAPRQLPGGRFDPRLRPRHRRRPAVRPAPAAAPGADRPPLLPRPGRLLGGGARHVRGGAGPLPRPDQDAADGAGRRRHAGPRGVALPASRTATTSATIPARIARRCFRRPARWRCACGRRPSRGGSTPSGRCRRTTGALAFLRGARGARGCASRCRWSTGSG